MKNNILNLIACQILAMAAVWVLLSFLQVITQNCGGTPEYSWWNLFCLVVGK